MSTLAILGSMLAIFILAGRRKPVDTHMRPKIFSEHLDQDLQISESKFDDLIPGTEKIIIWADSAKTKTPYSLVYLHGFSASRQETAPLADTLAKRWGANLFYTRLAGHGRSGEAMVDPTANDWLNDADEAMEIGRLIGEKVIVLGTSTGGTLATWLAARGDTTDLAAIILISPNYWVKAAGAGAMLWPWGKQILQMVRGPVYEWTPVNDLHEKYWTNSYPSIVLVEMMKLLDYVNNMDFGKIETPSLFIYSPNDAVVDASRIEAAYQEFGASKKQIQVIENADDRNNHVLAGDILSPNTTLPIADIIDRFVKEID